MTFQSLIVKSPSQHYPIFIGENLLRETHLLQKYIKGQQILFVTNETIAPLYLMPLMQQFKNFQCDTVTLPDGEMYKSLEQTQKIWDALIQFKHRRSTTLIALGGGVIGDMTGFAAACYQRGVNFLQIPTTLLAQVDASVGGKTAVNHPLGKNMIGAFHQPSAVYIDVCTLRTLPNRHFSAGMAEVIKYALIHDMNFFEWINENADALLTKNIAVLTTTIKKCCEIKAEIVEKDEKDQHDVRALVNFGHTFAHAIEVQMQYKNSWLHGEAVAVGMVIAAELSHLLKQVSREDVDALKRLLRKFDLPVQLPAQLSLPTFLAAMQHDKKNKDQGMKFVLLRTPGNAYVTEANAIPEEFLCHVLHLYGLKG